MSIEIRTATLDDCAAIGQLIGESARTLGKPDYTDKEIEAALKGPWGLDTQLVKDGTYHLLFADGDLAGCGGWSFRRTLFGSDSEKSRDNTRLDPATDAARIRAFFVRPRYARQGFGSMLIRHCEKAAIAAGFDKLCLGATLPGQRLYQAHGFVAGNSEDYDLGQGMTVQIIPMTKSLSRLGV
jgi:GNAT superfamily N-acetyltransferase